MRRILLSGMMVLLTLSCGTEKEKAKKIKEGSIEYRITYIEENLKNYSEWMLPKKMVLLFNNRMASNTIEGFLGMFSVTNITDLKKRTSTTLLKFSDKKYVYYGEKDELPCCYGTLDHMTLNPIDSVKTLAGLECKAMQAVLVNPDTSTFRVYYTHAIDVDSPNTLNPFHEVDGTLMEFQVNMLNVRMHLRASRVEPGKIPDRQFMVPDDYVRISKSDMESILRMLLE